MYPQNTEELLSYVLSGSGFTPQDVRNAGGMVQVPPVMMQYRKWEKGMLRADGKPGFETPSGKFEIASTLLEEYGYDPLPVMSSQGKARPHNLSWRQPSPLSSIPARATMSTSIPCTTPSAPWRGNCRRRRS